MSNKSQILLIIVFTTFLAFGAKTIIASGEAYYDLNPDKYFTKPLNLASTTSTISLLFQPQNDFLSAFDFWFDNSGEPGTVTFKVRGANNSILSSKIITVPHIAPISGGKRIRIDLSTQIRVSNLEIYSIEIQTSMPNLQIYYLNRIEIIGYQVTIVSAYLIGVSKYNNTEQITTFKYALYEIDETGAPIIYATSTLNISTIRTKIFWRANEPIDYRIEYGTKINGLVTGSTSYNNSMTSCGEGEEFCFMNLTVTPGTEYFYNLFTKDEWGNEGVYSNTFTSQVGQIPSPTPENNNSIPPASNNGPSEPISPPWSQTSPVAPPIISLSPIAKQKPGPEQIIVEWPKVSATENYEVKITGKKTGYVSEQKVSNNVTKTSFQSIPTDTYTIEVFAVKGEDKQLVQEETTTANENSNFNFYAIVIGVILLILIILSIVYNKYKEYL